MTKLSPDERKLLRSVVDAAKANRVNPGSLQWLVYYDESNRKECETLLERGLVSSPPVSFGRTLFPTPAGIDAIAEAEAVELFAKVESALEKSEPPHIAVERLCNVVFEMAKRITVLEARS